MIENPVKKKRVIDKRTVSAQIDVNLYNALQEAHSNHLNISDVIKEGLKLHLESKQGGIAIDKGGENMVNNTPLYVICETILDKYLKK